MVKRIGSFRRKGRDKLSQKKMQRGKLLLRKVLQDLKIGDRVALKAEPAFHKGMYHLRFHSRTGIVKGKRGQCYEVAVNDGKKEKMVVVHPIHLIKV